MVAHNESVLFSFVPVGIVETGLFLNMASRVYYGNVDGTVIVVGK